MAAALPLLALGIGGNLAAKGISSLLGGKKKAAVPVADTGPKVMPLADDDAIKRAKTRSILSRRQSGRKSTMLSTDSDSLGG